MTGLHSFRYNYKRNICPLCDGDYKNPDTHIVYECFYTKDIHQNEITAEMIDDNDKYELKQGNVIPRYNQNKLNRLCKLLKTKYKLFKNQNDTGNKLFEINEKEILENENFEL